MAEITFYTNPMSRGRIVHWLLDELGVAYDMKVLDFDKGDHKKPEYLKINPMGKVPALRHGDVVVTEAAAICLYLAETFPQAGLNVPVGSQRRGDFLKWLFFGPSCIEPAVLDIAFPRKEPAPRGAVGWGNFDTVMDVVEQGLQPGPYILGSTFTAADVVIGSQLGWGMMIGLIPKRPAFVEYVDRLQERPAARRQRELDMQKPA